MTGPRTAAGALRSWRIRLATLAAMTGPDTETLTAALRRLADEHASGLLSVATPDRDVVLELADGVPVGIGPPHDVSGRVGRDASAELVAAAVIDGLVDRTVAAIVGGGGEWVWDVSDDATMMPVPPDLATELSRRAVDAAQALATLAPDQVLSPARDLETHGDVDRVRALFDGERTLTEVADLAELTLPATATLAAALVSAGVLATGQEDHSPRSWTDAVAGSSIQDDDEDEPELWVMDPPDDEDWDEEDEEEDEEPATPAAAAAPEDGVAADRIHTDQTDDTDQTDQTDPPDAPSVPATADLTAADTQQPVTADAEATADAQPAAADAEATADAPPAAADTEAAAAAHETGGDDWADTTWLDEIDVSDRRAAAATAGDGRDDEPNDPRAALSAMITDLQGQGQAAPEAPRTPATPTEEQSPRGGGDADDATSDDGSEQRVSAEPKRKEPKAAPGEVAEFLRELSRLALDDE